MPRRRDSLAVALGIIVLGSGGLLFSLFRSQIRIIDTLDAHSGLAAWAQAVLSVATIGAGFGVLWLQNHFEARASKEQDRDHVRLMGVVARSCAVDFGDWIRRLEKTTEPLGKYMSLRHLNVAVEGTMFREVGNTYANQLLIELRRIVQDFWWQIETADETLRKKWPDHYLPDALEEMRRLLARTDTIAAELDDMAGRNWTPG